MQNTEYLGLKKPESTDFYNVNDFNENFDTIDSGFKNLSNVDNTADFDKPMSNPQKVYVENLKAQIEKDIQDVARVTELALNKTTTHLSAKDNPHGVGKEDVGLGNVDNTADMDKPVSTATQKALEEFESKGKITDIATGEHITITNSTEASVREFKIDGKTEQVTTKGYQLFNKNDIHNGYYINGNNGSPQSFEYTCATGFIEIDSTKGHLYISSMPNYQWGAFYDVDKNYISTSSVSELGNVVEIPTNAKYIRCTVMNEYIDTFKINYGTSELPYEPYTNGASPNPDYPQDIKGVGDSGEVEVTVTGKNMFGGLDFARALSKVSATSNVDEVNKTVTFNHAMSSNFDGFYGKFKESMQYTIILYGSVVDSSTKNTSIVIRYTDGTHDTISIPTTDNYVIKHTTQGKSVEFIGLGWMDGAIAKLYYDKCGIFEGVISPEDFEPYKSQTIKIPVEPLIDPSPLYKGDYARLKDKNVEIVKNNKMVVFDGSDDEGWAYNNQYFYSSVITKAIANIYAEFYCDYFMPVDINTSVMVKDNVTGLRDNFVAINCSKFTTLTEWKAWLSQNPITVVYQLVEPETETSYADIDLSTYNHVTNITNSDNANMEVEYFTNSANGEVIVDLQEEIKRLDDEKAGISLLHDYVIVDHINTLNITVEVKCGTGDIFSVDRFGYVPLMATCKVINGANVICVSCSVKYVQGTGYVVESDFLNIGETTETVDAEITILYVKKYLSK